MQTSSLDPRFRFAHVERLVNEKIYSDLPVGATIMPLAEAKKIAGVRAVFGPGTNIPKAARRVLELIGEAQRGGRPAAVGA